MGNKSSKKSKTLHPLLEELTNLREIRIDQDHVFHTDNNTLQRQGSSIKMFHRKCEESDTKLVFQSRPQFAVDIVVWKLIFKIQNNKVLCMLFRGYPDDLHFIHSCYL